MSKLNFLQQAAQEVIDGKLHYLNFYTPKSRAEICRRALRVVKDEKTVALLEQRRKNGEISYLTCKHLHNMQEWLEAFFKGMDQKTRCMIGVLAQLSRLGGISDQDFQWASDLLNGGLCEAGEIEAFMDANLDDDEMKTLGAAYRMASMIDELDAEDKLPEPEEPRLGTDFYSALERVTRQVLEKHLKEA